MLQIMDNIVVIQFQQQMLKSKKYQSKSKSSLKLKTLECLNIKPLKSKRKSKGSTKTLTSSPNQSRKNLGDRLNTRSTLKLSIKNKSKGKMQLLTWCTQPDVKLRSFDCNKFPSSKKIDFSKLPQKSILIKASDSSNKSKCEGILNKLYYQMQYEKQLREVKHHINSSNIRFVAQQMSFYNICQKQLQLQIEQYDPLFIPNDVDNLGEELMKQISRCNKNWEMNIRKKFTKEAVMDLFQKLDTQMNGLINLNTTAKQLGTLSGKLIRNKDVLRIFKRLQNGSTISLCSLMRELCHEYDF